MSEADEEPDGNYQRPPAVAIVKRSSYGRTEVDEHARFADMYGSPPPGTVPHSSTSVTLGVCAMSKKSSSKPMKAILQRMESHGFVKLVIFSDDTILNKPVAEWPQVDALISFYSRGFPLEKAIQYQRLRKPFVVNDLKAQYLLMDRRKVYAQLEEHGVETPRYKVLNRETQGEVDLLEDAESVCIDGVSFTKPFVEKPVDAEDHNVYIYYPPSAGGGSQRLFRKIRNRSSVYSSEHKVRTSGSFVYEDFMPTDGTDVKVYTVGPNYAHAEARKSPALDGKVERDAQGKEVRYPVILSAYEKEVARKVCVAFKQNVCGFDLLRANGKSLVCDVNGFSFVKTSQKYYADCAQILNEMILRNVAPHLFQELQDPEKTPDIPLPLPATNDVEELRCVIGVIRHGDRTPKQKMKFVVHHPRFFDLFFQYGGERKPSIKLKKPEQLQKVLDAARCLLEEPDAGNSEDISAIKLSLQQLKFVLEMHGHFSGINRKVQMKYKLAHRMSMSFRRGSYQPSRTSGVLLLILKWGGELTPAGRVQAEELGRSFRCIYPGGQGEYGSLPGCGLLRLHSTYRHDLKIYAADEGRVQMTAAAFAKGFLALEGELTPILIHLVKSSKTNSMLDKSDDASDLLLLVKERLHQILGLDRDLTAEDMEELAPTHAGSILKAMKKVGNPSCMSEDVHRLVSSIVEQVQSLDSSQIPKLYHNENLALMQRRWEKLQKDFKQKDGKFDHSKIPDIYDCVLYDKLHNSHLGLNDIEELFDAAQALANIAIPQEYGMTHDEKVEIARRICTPLVRKLRSDFKHQSADMVHRLNPEYSRDISSPDRHVRTRLYFTSESHIHSVLNLLRYGGLFPRENCQDQTWLNAMKDIEEHPQLSYMTQVVFLLYENAAKDVDSEERFRVEVHFSPGAVSAHPLDEGTWSTEYLTASCVCGDGPNPLFRSDNFSSPPEVKARSENLEREKSASCPPSVIECSSQMSATPCTPRPSWIAPEASVITSTPRLGANALDVSNCCTPGQLTYPRLVSQIQPLVTLHGNISLKTFDTFLEKVTTEMS